MSQTQAILFVLVAVVMGWFALGVIWNIRQGNAALKWMQGGLPRIGEKTTLRWLGSSAVELAIEKAKPPFRRAEFVLVMEPRDVPWFWLLSRMRGRRDMLIVRGQLTHAPQFEYDLLAAGSWSELQAMGLSAARRWEIEPMGEARFRAPAATRALSRQLAPAALETARRAHPMVWRLSSRREFPQIELHIPLPRPTEMNAAQFFKAVCELAEQMGKRN